MRRRSRRKRSDISSKLNNVLYFLTGVLAITLVGIGVLAVQTNSGSSGVDLSKEQITVADTENVFGGFNAAETKKYEFQENQDIAVGDTPKAVSDTGDNVEKWQEGLVEYKGENYIYNSKLKIYLLMGIDNEGPVETAKDSVSGGQSDAMFLLVSDEENEKLSVISINRNTMTEVEVYDKTGNQVGKWNAQICVQHGFGDGKKLSCIRSVNAVSKLFNNIPIYGYIAINMGAIPALNDAVGGVTVKVLSDLNYSDRNVNLKKGEEVKLNGNEAYCYLRGRNINEFDSASDRLRRDEQYLMNFMKILKNEETADVNKAVRVYNSISDYLVTNVDFKEVMKNFMDFEVQKEDIYTVPGKTTMGEEFEEYHVEDDEFRDLIMKVFYKKA